MIVAKYYRETASGQCLGESFNHWSRSRPFSVGASGRRSDLPAMASVAAAAGCDRSGPAVAALKSPEVLRTLRSLWQRLRE